MKTLQRSPLAWAALALALAAGSLVAQDGDPQARKIKLFGEALTARDEGNLQGAKEKFEQILQIDAKDLGATEGLAGINGQLEAAAKKAAAAPPAPGAPAAPAAEAPPAPTAGPLAEVSAQHEKLFAEVRAAMDLAKKDASEGRYDIALKNLDGASSALPATAAAQKLRDDLGLAKQDVLAKRETGDKGPQGVSAEKLAEMNQAEATRLAKAKGELDAAEDLVRQGDAKSLDAALRELDRINGTLGADSVTNRDLKANIKELKGAALARRALVAIEAREPVQAEVALKSYEALKGADDASVKRLKAEFAERRLDPTYRGVDETSPGLRQKDEKVDELLVKGRARYLYGDYQGALDAYREVLQYQPNNSESKAYQIRIRQMLSENSGQWNRGVTKGKLLELLDETWKLPEVFNRENVKVDVGGLNDPVLDKMKNIVLPDGITIRPQPLDRALQMIAQSSKTYDKDQAGVEIQGVGLAANNPEVSITFNNKVNVYTVLEYLCKRNRLSFSVGSAGIVEVREESGDTLLETEIYPLSQPAVLKMTGLSATTSTPAAGGGAAANPFAGAGGAAGGATGEAPPQEVAIKNFLTRSGVSFELPASLTYDGTNLLVYQSRKNLDRVKNIIRRYSDIKQVHIESKFMEVEQKVLNELGTNWTLRTPGSALTAARANTNLRSINSVFQNNNQIAKELVISDSTGDTSYKQGAPTFPGGINLGNTTQSFQGNVGVIGSYDLAVAVRAIEENAGSDLMSSPSLTVLDGKTAVIKVAQLLRYPQAYGDTQSNVGTGGGGGTGVTAGASVAITAGTPQDFTIQEVGVSMEVTPTVGADDSIALILKPKVTEFEGFVEYGGTSVALTGGITVTVPSGFFTPIFSTREVSTEVTVFDGATVVIGGLTREEVKTVEDRVPILGSIPLIGTAFRSSGKSVQKRSLLIFVTANLISPGGATLRTTHPGMRAGSTFSNPTLISPGGAVYREPIEVVTPPSSSGAPKPADEPK